MADIIVTNELIIEALAACGNDQPQENHKALMKSLLSVIELNPDCKEAQLLSKRERTCLFWIAHDKSAREICQIMNIKISTFNTYINRMKVKLKSKTLPNAVFKALCYYPSQQQREILITEIEN